MKNQALLLADEIQLWNNPCARAAAELRRLHEENKLLHERHSLDNKEVVRLHEANKEMLEALKEAEPMLVAMLNNITHFLPEFKKMPALDSVRAAIAKGEQQ